MLSDETYTLLDRYRRFDDLTTKSGSHYISVLTLRAYRDFSDSLRMDRGQPFVAVRNKLDYDFPLPEVRHEVDSTLQEAQDFVDVAQESL